MKTTTEDGKTFYILDVGDKVVREYVDKQWNKVRYSYSPRTVERVTNQWAFLKEGGKIQRCGFELNRKDENGNPVIAFNNLGETYGSFTLGMKNGGLN